MDKQTYYQLSSSVRAVLRQLEYNYHHSNCATVRIGDIVALLVSNKRYLLWSIPSDNVIGTVLFKRKNNGKVRIIISGRLSSTLRNVLVYYSGRFNQTENILSHYSNNCSKLRRLARTVSTNPSSYGQSQLYIGVTL